MLETGVSTFQGQWEMPDHFFPSSRMQMLQWLGYRTILSDSINKNDQLALGLKLTECEMKKKIHIMLLLS